MRVRRAADRPTLAVNGGYTRTNHVEEFGVPQPSGGLRVIYPDIPDNYFTRAVVPVAHLHGRARRCARTRGGRRGAGDWRRAAGRARGSAARSRARVLGAGHGDRSGAASRGGASTRADAHRARRAQPVRRRLDPAQRGLYAPKRSVAPADAADRSAQHPASVVEDLKRLTGLPGRRRSRSLRRQRRSTAPGLRAAGEPGVRRGRRRSALTQRAERQALVERLAAAEIASAGRCERDASRRSR